MKVTWTNYILQGRIFCYDLFRCVLPSPGLPRVLAIFSYLIIKELTEQFNFIKVLKNAVTNKICGVSGRLRCARADLRATRPRRERAAPPAAAAEVEIVERSGVCSQSASQSVSLEAALLVWMVLSRTDFFTGIFSSMAG